MKKSCVRGLQSNHDGTRGEVQGVHTIQRIRCTKVWDIKGLAC
jgi:hypothetical protein